MPILFATSNPHKVRELWQILTPLGVEVRGLDSLGENHPEPAEEGATFEENARIKAMAYARLTGLACLAEDSGLEVDALSGAPGVHSARYSGAGGPREARDRANNEKLLRELEGVPEEARTARFVSALCFVDARGRVLYEGRGAYEGIIARAPSGEGGFGYDPLLYLPDVGKTSAELTPEEKNARSHRGKAVRAFAEWLREHPEHR
jgi:XTP/dITP diphosphohydrolase